MIKKGGINILRVISGQAKGHKLKTIKGNNTRPTADRVKESLFNIITSYILDADVLDLFAGTGNLGIEALSRGAASAVFVDKSQECYNVIKDNLSHTKLEENAAVIAGDVFNTVDRLSKENKKFDIIFLDPPYNKNLIEETLKIIDKNDIINDNGIVITEKDIADIIPEEVGKLKLARNQKYGDTVLSFYKKV
jgi:16S rRNA (guanine966-N2)-methyltransferase